MSGKKEIICTICKKPKPYTFTGICFECSNVASKLVGGMTVADLKDLILWCLDHHEKIDADRAQAEWERLQKVKGEKL